MIWSGWAEFFAMGGYGLYVWGSFAMCAAVQALEVLLIATRRRTLAREAFDAPLDGKESKV